jgi:hypothetical protein
MRDESSLDERSFADLSCVFFPGDTPRGEAPPPSRNLFGGSRYSRIIERGRILRSSHRARSPLDGRLAIKYSHVCLFRAT